MGQHISLKADTEDGTMLLRPYTPVTDNDQRGLVDFVIKASLRATAVLVMRCSCASC